MGLPDFSYEKRLWKNNISIVSGIDEVGRGSIAGPVVAAAVCFAVNSDFQFPIYKDSKKIVINDSKRLTALQRKHSAKWIKKHALTFGIGTGSTALINRCGITSATNFAFRSALRNAQIKLATRIQYLLIDAFYIPNVRGLNRPLKYHRNIANRVKAANAVKLSGRQLAITGGDGKSISIAAASIIAKVYRDKLMKKLSLMEKYKKYGWEKNKGYGTKYHQEAILKYVVSKHHRKAFIRKLLSKKV